MDDVQNISTKWRNSIVPTYFLQKISKDTPATNQYYYCYNYYHHCKHHHRHYDRRDYHYHYYYRNHYQLCS
jgi:hypothetical protein